jgi:hypothetical protein
VRWDGQRADGETPQTTLPGVGELVRSVRTPEFNGLVFHEIRAKSVLNRVPGASTMPFQWTVNPYRGCSHGCTYCLGGETPVLMADGRTRPIGELRIGDLVYGTRRDGRYRRYVPTEVLAHWWTTKPAYRVTLEDGTRIVASGEHRFLTDRGWKHVTGHTSGTARRPHLTLGNKLMGTGRFAEPPVATPSYRRGYLCGLVRGSRATRGRAPRFPFGTNDPDIAERARRFLAELGVDSAPAARLNEVTALPTSPDGLWRKGFLAGVFDSRGSHSNRVLRIRNSDTEVVHTITQALTRFDFEFAIEQPRRMFGPWVIRVVGGLTEHLRFFHTVDPAAVCKRAIEGQAVKSSAALDVVSVEPTGLTLPLVDITTGTGDFIANGVVSHNCSTATSPLANSPDDDVTESAHLHSHLTY